ncbi:hypothetical protein ACVNP1_09790 [Staphylococcus aureus]
MVNWIDVLQRICDERRFKNVTNELVQYRKINIDVEASTNGTVPFQYI